MCFIYAITQVSLIHRALIFSLGEHNHIPLMHH
jgi:hypothetical protein